MRKKIIFYTLGAVMIIAAAELSLQLLSFTAQRLSQKPVDDFKKKGRVVLCIGESTTAWGGEYSYPSLLQKKLDELYGKNYFQVVNEGIAGVSSETIRSTLDEKLDLYKPEYVITMLGINDPWSLVEKNNFLYQFRLYKLYKISKIHIKIIFNELSISDLKHYPLQMISMLRQLDNSKTGEAEHAFSNQIKLSREVFNSGKYNETLEVINSIPSNYRTSDTWVIYILSLIYENQLQDAFQNLENYHVILGDERSLWCWVSLWEKLMSLNQFEQAEKAVETALRLLPQNATLTSMKIKTLKALKKPHDHLIYYGIENYEAFPPMRANYSLISDKIKSRNAVHIVMQYPRRKIDDLKTIFKPNNKIIYVENFNNFEKKLADTSYDLIFTDRFAGHFGHMTPLGHQLIVDNLVEAFQEIKGR